MQQSGLQGDSQEGGLIGISTAPKKLGILLNMVTEQALYAGWARQPKWNSESENQKSDLTVGPNITSGPSQWRKCCKSSSTWFLTEWDLKSDDKEAKKNWRFYSALSAYMAIEILTSSSIDGSWAVLL
ncbi:hypothetical protein Y1Q_0014475 [Alligator mississippiensis]|uniref:Uncharacterized protein n=1 Tax=Alligator mississippiensis TaxID=8496 RepID=A0A151PD74_ALLMI|nr:hypothetical protein Y1Q_0014475 [Alligator mississippiensis]